jgi:hypothetical protein
MSGVSDPYNPHFVDAIIAFVDVLGFRSMLENRAADDILRVFQLLKWTAERDPNETETSAHVRVLSDRVIRVTRLDEPGALFSEVNTLRLAQMELAAQGIFLRGGITFGEVYWDETVVFGPGIVDASHLEHNFALVPRIVIGPPALCAIRKGLIRRDNVLSQELAYLRTMLSRAEDGVWFIDYLRNADREMDGPEMYCDLLKRHKGAILAASSTIDRKTAGSSLAMKIGWLARYHNDTVSKLSDSCLAAMRYDRDSLSINVDELPGLVDLPDPGAPLRADCSGVM